MKNLIPIRDRVLAEMTDGFGFGSTAGGVITPPETSDAMAYQPRPRWFKAVYAGPEQNDVEPGQWILVAHGRWSRGFDVEGHDGKLHFIDNDEILGVQDDEPEIRGERRS